MEKGRESQQKPLVAAVENQKEDVPYDSENPLYSFGFGLGY
ncbi:MAG: hypothetical protein ACI8P3_004024 [Saprospiraceae bacterium]|jgi:hypothetical protein